MTKDPMPDISAVVLAAGQGTRMRSSLPKVLHPLAGAPMLSYVLDTLLALGVGELVVVTGYQEERVRAAVAEYPVRFVNQPRQLGTGHAVRQTREALGERPGHMLVINGDTPLLTVESLRRFAAFHLEGGYEASLLSALFPDPAGYGRVLRNPDDTVAGIVEQKDATLQEAAVREIATGIYCFAAPLIFSLLEELTPDNSQGEYYLPDVIRICCERGLPVGASCLEDMDEVMGINDRGQLARAEFLVRERINRGWMKAGVSMIDPRATYIDKKVVLGADTLLYPQTVLEGDTAIGSGCTVGPGCYIKDSRIGDNVLFRGNCFVVESEVKAEAVVGPYSHLRPHTLLEKGAKVGNFVEIKKSSVGEGSKVNHLTYIGDAVIGKGVNIGAGTITCNYDGVNKHTTVIGDGVFIGSGTQLVAPVNLGENAWVGAGSTITHDVPPKALALTRTRQVHKDKWVKRKKKV